MGGLTMYQILCLIGVPSILGSITGAIISKFNSHKALKLGLQALLRAQMINDFNKWHDRGYAPIYARENFENCWQQYHALGANGVMDDIRTKFMSLPTEIIERG